MKKVDILIAVGLWIGAIIFILNEVLN